MGSPNEALVLRAEESAQLQALARSRSLPHSLVRRVEIVVMAVPGGFNRAAAARCGVSAPTVSLWRQRYRQHGIAGLHGELRPGRPRSYDDEPFVSMKSE